MKTRSLACLAAAAAFIAVDITGVVGSAAAATAVNPNSHVVPFANTCNLSTQAVPGSQFWGSFTDCHLCLIVAAGDSRTYLVTFYCTYNPANGLADLHSL